LVARQDVERLGEYVGTRDDAINEIGPVERADEQARVVQAELRGDVLLDARRSRSGIRMYADGRKTLLELGQLAIFGAEVVPPVADAVGLVDRKRPHGQALDQAQEPGREEALGGDKDETVLPGGDLALCLLELVARHAAVQGCGGVAMFAQAV